MKNSERPYKNVREPIATNPYTRITPQSMSLKDKTNLTKDNNSHLNSAINSINNFSQTTNISKAFREVSRK